MEIGPFRRTPPRDATHCCSCACSAVSTRSSAATRRGRGSGSMPAMRTWAVRRRARCSRPRRGWSVSPSIWTRCAGPSEVGALRGRFCRVVEAQFRNSTRKLVDSDAEQELLEELIDRRAKLPVPAGFEDLHYLLYTPFRHPPLRNGSRFGTRLMRGILYGSRELPTAFAEVAYYRLVFLEGPAVDLGELRLELTAFWFGIAASRGVDLSIPPFREYEARISSKTRYDASQRLGAEMRSAGVQCCLYVSARAAERH